MRAVRGEPPPPDLADAAVVRFLPPPREVGFKDVPLRCDLVPLVACFLEDRGDFASLTRPCAPGLRATESLLLPGDAFARALRAPAPAAVAFTPLESSTP